MEKYILILFLVVIGWLARGHYDHVTTPATVIDVVDIDDLDGVQIVRVKRPSLIPGMFWGGRFEEDLVSSLEVLHLSVGDEIYVSDGMAFPTYWESNDPLHEEWMKSDYLAIIEMATK